MTWQNLENDVIIVSVAQFLYGITVKTSGNGRGTINFVCSTQDSTFENPKLQQPPTVWKNLGRSRAINKTVNNICITISSSFSPPPSYELLKLFNNQQTTINLNQSIHTWKIQQGVPSSTWTLTCGVHTLFHVVWRALISFISSVHFDKAQQPFRFMIVSLFLFFPAPITLVMIT